MVMTNHTVLLFTAQTVSHVCLNECLRECGARVVEVPLEGGIVGDWQTVDADLAIICSQQENADDALQAARRIRSFSRQLPVILITVHSSIEHVISAMRAGVSDYFRTPLPYRELIASIREKLHERTERCSAEEQGEAIIGESSQMRMIKAYAAKVAATDSTVLITGETGTGKELVADQIRLNSPRRNKPFVCINCTALPESLLESELFGFERGAFTGAHSAYIGKLKMADGGTVLLDEIGGMNPYCQAKILRVIENKQFYRIRGEREISVDVRFMAAANQNPEQLVSEGKLREDLYYRLNVARVDIPPLRERKEDIPLLIHHYIQEMNGRFGMDVKGFTEEASTLLMHYDWPGNVRELRNLVEATFIGLQSKQIAFVGLPKRFQKKLEQGKGRPPRERDRIVSALLTTNWNKSRAAKNLCWSRMTLYRKMAKHDIVAKPGP